MPIEELKGLAAEIGMKNAFSLLEREVFLNLAKTYAVLSDQIDEVLKPHHLSSPQYNVLRILRGHGQPVSVYEIAKQMITSQSDMPRLVERLVGKGLAEKRRSETDRRVVWVSLTKKGRELLKRIDAPLDAAHQEQFKHLTKAQMKLLSELLWVVRHPE